ncbi:hypothetical protein H6G89_12200 [Oscillatoria sp. FACHB-1407]|uniref:hypothetical protein n=1 Tax=Oscillatoria sp. FACHB-1407 TaxID=2692847 RepID=UPI00168A19E9|nr:hypothetical protein [Oscillatoria sp. FACHB-1407]MBD2461811.1 hypothetical protein [Oscillatoria sp. FACHB-1407]
MATTKTKTSPTQLSNTTRVLLALWDLGGVGREVKQGDLTKRIVPKGQKSSDYKPLLDQLEKDGAIATTKATVSLTDQGANLLGKNLSNAEFTFASNVGAKTANALLKWIREMDGTLGKAETNGNGKKASGAIESYEAFKTVALETYNRLNKDYNLDNLVPIYRIRREIGDRVSRSNFNEWMLELQTNDVFQLLEGSIEDSAPDKIEDSITTKLGKLRCYAKRMSA